ncbi:MAG TPA: hypothetical protein VKJ47_04170 [Candidatus Binatia bacterium]|nr:hypothetical protein [Candidatus Binatia bacterium]
MAENHKDTSRARFDDLELSILIDDRRHLCTAIYRVIGGDLREDEDFAVIHTLAESIEARCEEAKEELAKLSEAYTALLRQKRDAKEEKAQKPSH